MATTSTMTRSPGLREDLQILRRDILDSPVAVSLERARVFTRIWQQNEGAPWIVKKALAFREHLETVPLYIRPYDRLAGSISDIPGAMPLIVELGVGENSIYVGENPERRGYLRDQVPGDILDYWEDRNLWGKYRAYARTVKGVDLKRTEVAGYKYISAQGHLSPSYGEVLEVGLEGLLNKIRDRRGNENDPERLEFLTAAENSLLGVMGWIKRYSEFLRAESDTHPDAGRRRELGLMSGIAAAIAKNPPDTFREAMQLIWFIHQAIHIEGHGYSCTPDRVDQLLYPFYRKDREDGLIDDEEVLHLCENFILKMRDNTVWGVEHNLTQGLAVGGSTADGEDQTNELSWLFITASGNASVPEPLVWLRWHPNMDKGFFDHCLQNLAGTTCFPLMMSDSAVPAMFMELGVSREDAYNYVPVGCNELGIPGMAYFNPGASVSYLHALALAITGGRGFFDSHARIPAIPDPADIRSFDDLMEIIGRIIRHQVERSYKNSLGILKAQIRWAKTPLTSCFFDGCIERAQDLMDGTKYNILSAGGSSFANMIDSLAAIREVVFEKKESSLEEIVAACRNNFEGYEELRSKLLAAPKHGNDLQQLDDLIALVQRLRDEPVKEICRDPRDNTQFVNIHIVRSGAVRGGARTPATPDGRLAGLPLANSVAASHGADKSGPTALINSILKMDPVKSWQGGYNVNMRFQKEMLTDEENRGKVSALLESYFRRGGQEMQINCVDTEELKAAQKTPDDYRDLVVRVAGFSEFFVRLDPAIQEEIISRTEHRM